MHPSDIQGIIERVGRLLARCDALCVLTGAGMSAESGVATFRGTDGLWSRFNPAELATPEAFARNPRKVWEWYRLRRQQLRAVEPHVGHRLLASWEGDVASFLIVTQNVDGLHQRAGSQRVVELHGRLDEVRCTVCGQQRATLDDLGADPRCACGGRLRPGVVWFGEMLPPGAFQAAEEAARSCSLMLVIGTSGVVQPAASLAETARGRGADLVVIDPNETALDGLASVCVRLGCGAALRRIDEAWRRAGS